MGVPSFYRWLVHKYPKVVLTAPEDPNITTSSNSNKKFDNLFLDMNGIIHPCFHPEISPPTSFEEVFKNIFEYIDLIFSFVRPSKLLYMAIDGVAPRAKMNQQRSRRFQAAKNMEVAQLEENRLRKEFLLLGKDVLSSVESEVTDSNVITPGTYFMHELSKALQIFAIQRLKNHPDWRNIKVILSDATVPGEGEHKIMSFIRLQRTCSGYNPNTRHCLYGLDADLIMLALATHEVHFSIIRESVSKTEQQLMCESLQVSLLVAESNPVDSKKEIKQVDEKVNCKKSIGKIPFEFIDISILRQYLEIDIEICDLPESMKNKNIDLERIIDDFIFLCFFAGNDFLPHVPSLELHEGAIDLLIYVYKSKFKNIGGYLVDMQRANTRGEYINLKRVEKFILLVSVFEEKIFKKRSEVLDRKIRRILSQLADATDEENENHSLESSTPVNPEIGCLKDHVPSSSTESFTANNFEIKIKNTKELKEMVKESMKNKSDLLKSGCFDKLRLGYDGWKERYYQQKFRANTREDIEGKRKEIVQRYTEGLCWVLLYYFSGVPSWKWFYPFHYGPFASDMKGLAGTKVNFNEENYEKGLPFDPFVQLMGVLPPRSAHALPKAYLPLMTDENSKLKEFYPKDFEVDTDGKRFLWQGICTLPFIDEKRLLSETENLKSNLEEDEMARNTTGAARLFLRSSNPLGEEILSLDNNKCYQIPINSSLMSEGVSGYIDLPSKICHDIQDKDIIICVPYNLRDDDKMPLHIPRVLEGAVFPEKIITKEDIEETQLWHELQGNRSQTNSETHSSKGFNIHGRGTSISPMDQSLRMNDCRTDLSFRGPSYGFKGRGRSTSFHNSPNEYIDSRNLYFSPTEYNNPRNINFSPACRSYRQVSPSPFPQPVVFGNTGHGGFVNSPFETRPMPFQSRPWASGMNTNEYEEPGYGWHQSAQPSFGTRTWQQNPNPNPHFPYGRGQYVPRNPSTIARQPYGGSKPLTPTRTWQQDPNPNPNPNSLYGSQVPYGRGGQYEGPRYVYRPQNPSFQAFGRGSDVQSTQQNPSSTSGRGFGRVRYVPKTPPTVTQKNSFSALSENEK